MACLFSLSMFSQPINLNVTTEIYAAQTVYADDAKAVRVSGCLDPSKVLDSRCADQTEKYTHSFSISSTPQSISVGLSLLLHIHSCSENTMFSRMMCIVSLYQNI